MSAFKWVLSYGLLHIILYHTIEQTELLIYYLQIGMSNKPSTKWKIIQIRKKHFYYFNIVEKVKILLYNGVSQVANQVNVLFIIHSCSSRNFHKDVRKVLLYTTTECRREDIPFLFVFLYVSMHLSDAWLIFHLTESIFPPSSKSAVFLP